MISITCHKCFKIFERPKKEIDRHLRNGRKYFFCSLSCSTSLSQTIHGKVKSNCLFCHKKFETTTHKKAHKCCSRKCACKYAQSKVDPIRHIQSLQNSFRNIKTSRPKNYPKQREFVCVMCRNTFSHLMRDGVSVIKTCSKECYSKYASQWTRNNPNCGGKLGYRRFPYGGYKMDSRWEVEIAKWMDEHKIKWDRSRKRHMFKWVDNDGNERKYFPDFYLPEMNVYLDPKNDYYLERDLPKLKYVINKYRITLFYGGVDDIKNHLTSLLTCDILLV